MFARFALVKINLNKLIVQNSLPLEGKVAPKVTDEVVFVDELHRSINP